MDIFHTHGIVQWSVTKAQFTEDEPDLEGIIKEKVKDVCYDLRRIDFADDTREEIESKVDDATRSLDHFSTDIPKDIEDYTKQSAAIRGMVEDMGNSGLAALAQVNKLEELISTSSLDKSITNSLLDKIIDIKSELDGVFTNQSTSLYTMMTNHLWPSVVIERVKQFLDGRSVFMDVLEDKSAAHRLVFGRGDWLEYGNNSITFKSEKDILIASKDYFTTLEKGEKHNHDWRNFGSYFNDWLNPTPQEQAVYTMATERVWDISQFRSEILSRKS